VRTVDFIAIDYSLIASNRAGLAGAFVDREAETRGMDEVDRIRAREQGQFQVHVYYNG
jgi:hypothetical protein